MAIVVDKILKVESKAFSNNAPIPPKHTCLGSNINPELTIDGIPEGTKSLALIMDDSDAPNGIFDHWVMWNIPIKDRIEENSAPGIQGKNGENKNNYTGPCPSSGTHHYYFRIYALDIKLDLPASTDKNELLKAIDGHILGLGELIGTFKK